MKLEKKNYSPNKISSKFCIQKHHLIAPIPHFGEPDTPNDE